MSRIGALHNVENNQAEEVLQRTVAALVYDNQRGQYLNTTLNGFTNRINQVDGKIKFATTQQAQQGINDDSIMTPLKTKQLGDANYLSKSNPVLNGNLIISNDYPTITLSENGGDTFQFVVDSNSFSLRRGTGTYPIYIEGDNTVSINGINIPQLFQSVSNGKALVAAAITGKGVPTAADASFQTLSDNINLISTGLKVASGTVTSSSASLDMVGMDGTSVSRPRVVVSGLTFLPRYILLSDSQFTADSTAQTVYNADLGVGFSGAVVSRHTRPTSNQQTFNINPNSTNTYVTSTGFALPVYNQSATVQWVAIG